MAHGATSIKIMSTRYEHINHCRDLVGRQRLTPRRVCHATLQAARLESPLPHVLFGVLLARGDLSHQLHVSPSVEPARRAPFGVGRLDGGVAPAATQHGAQASRSFERRSLARRHASSRRGRVGARDRRAAVAAVRCRGGPPSRAPRSGPDGRLVHACRM